MTRLPLTGLSLFFLLAACGPLVQIGGNSPPPKALYTLTATNQGATTPGGAIDLQKAISVAIPTVPATLQTLRIPVQVDETAVQYATTAQWSEQPNRLFQRLLADSLANQGIAVIDSRSTGTRSDRYLTGQLLAFGADAQGAPMVHVRYDATLVAPDGIRQQRFKRQVPVAAIEGRAIAVALNEAANAVATDVATWLQGQ